MFYKNFLNFLHRMAAAAEGGAAALFEVIEVPGAGRGLRARRDVEEGERILVVPPSRCWPTTTMARTLVTPIAHASEGDGAEDLSDEAVVALWLLQERKLGSESSFANSFLLLPQELHTILQWSEDEVKLLQGSFNEEAAMGLREETVVEWEFISSQGSWSAWREAHSEVNEHTFRWAKAVVLSRQIDLELEDGSKVVPPGMDMLNHDACGAPNCEVDTDQGDGDGVTVIVNATRKVAAGEELLLSYGPLQNAGLLMTYGFVAEANSYDCVEFVLSFKVPRARRSCLRALVRYAEKEAAATALPPAFDVVGDPGDDAGPDEAFQMQHRLYRAVPLPVTLVASIRLQVFPDSEFDALAASADASGGGADTLAAILCTPAGPAPGAAGEAMGVLAGILQSYASKYPSPGSPVESADGGAAISPQHRSMASTVIAGERAIWAAALEAMHVAPPS